jgi:hypothetical protein
MLLHRISDRAKRLLPRRLFSAVRTVGNIALTPALFSYYTGHARSALCGRPVDRFGYPVPWYTYPANHFLLAKDLRDRDVLEFGAGQSTLWWAGRARSVTSFEADPAWHARLATRVPPHVSLHLCRSFPDIEARIGARRFDIIIIDGLDVEGLGRTGCAIRSPRWLREGGAVILDNSDGSWSPDGQFRIMDFFRQEAYSRVDFYGWGPANIAPSCTSVFFRDRCFLLSGAENPIHPFPLAQHE